MKANPAAVAKQILDNYLEQNNCRKTPERYAVLDAAYSFSSYFSIQDLNDKLVGDSFPVSRATLYNTIKVLLELHVLACRRFSNGMRYKACFADNTCFQVCMVCGEVKEIRTPEIAECFADMHLKRFRKEHFTMHVYGTCSKCQAMLTRQKNKENTNNKNNKNKQTVKYGKRQS